jgi:murein DD-endopeptidase MepM/ murein hydrolase activator NlpD
MWALFKVLMRHWDEPLTVLVMEDAYSGVPRPYVVHPLRFWVFLGSMAGIIALGLFLIVLATPIREWLPGMSSAEVQHRARLSMLRVAALEDSLAAQQRYMMQLRRLILGEVVAESTVASSETHAPLPSSPLALELSPALERRSSDQPAVFPIPELVSPSARTSIPVAFRSDPLLQLQFPILPPVEGFLTRGFDAKSGHYGVDLAVEEGTMVRAIGSGYVVFADWTHAGGFVIIVQHADGYISVYKHNQRLLKQIGDRVRDREAIALSGNTGEVTTGPHLHFELWRHGLAQDPLNYFVTR